MAYKTLQSVFHMSPRGGQDADDLYTQRISSEATLTWEFNVRENPTFCVLTPELVKATEHVLRKEREILNLWNRLPRAAADGYLTRLFIQEIEATNEIEQVHSTRKEISEALNTKLGRDKQKRRFLELARMYMQLSSGELPQPSTLEDIRRIFDAITDGELAAEDRIEGPLFRSQATSIVNGVKEIHKAVPADQIASRLEVVLQTMHDEEIPILVAAMVTHFMFEYVHPFYDGNGRTGRFLLSQKLKQAVSIPTALTLSPVIYQRRNEYYKAFETAEHPLNRADLTPFVLKMLEFLTEAQSNLLTDLSERHQKFQVLGEHIEKLGEGKKDQRRQAKALFLLGQAWLFKEGSQNTLTLQELADYFQETPQTVRRDLKQLEEQGLIISLGSRPMQYSLSQRACTKLGIEVDQ